MNLEKIRLTANELSRDRAIMDLLMGLQNLIGQLKTAFPTLQINSSFFSHGNYSTSLSGSDIMFGRGPRFCSKYNLARSDEERQALLDTLPNFSGSKVDYHDLLGNYRTDLVSSRFSHAHSSLEMCSEFIEWLEVNRAKGNIIKFTGTFEELIGILPYSLKSDDTVGIPSEVLLYEFARSNTDEISTLIVLPCELSQSFAVFEMKKQSMKLVLISNVYWSVHELCWAPLSADSVHTEGLMTALDKLTKTLSLPRYDKVTKVEMLSIAERMLERVKSFIREESFLSRRDKIESRTITLENSLMLEITPPASHYSSWEFKCYLLDDPRDIEAASFFKPVGEVGFNSDWSDIKPFFRLRDSRSGDHSIENHSGLHPRQFRRVFDLLDRFIEAPNDSLMIVDRLRESINP